MAQSSSLKEEFLGTIVHLEKSKLASTNTPVKYDFVAITSNGTIEKAIAQREVENNKLIGVIVEINNSTNEVLVLTKGVFKTAYFNTIDSVNITYGAKLYLSDVSAGKLKTTAPTTGVGKCISLMTKRGIYIDATAVQEIFMNQASYDAIKGNLDSFLSIQNKLVSLENSINNIDLDFLTNEVSNIKNNLANFISIPMLTTTAEKGKVPKIDENGNITTDSFKGSLSTGRRIVNPIGGEFSGPASCAGIIKIKLPVSWSNHMIKATVKIYDYSYGESFDVIFGGYNYATSSAWINTFAYVLTDKKIDRNLTVRFGHDGGTCCVYIGETNSSWDFLQVFVTDIQLGYDSVNVEDWKKNWQISVETTLGTISETQTDTQIGRNILNSQLTPVSSGIIKGRVSSGTGNVEDITVTQLRTFIGNSSSVLDGLMSISDKVKLDASTNINTANAIVKRDSNGDFVARNITATSFIGALNGNANSATVFQTARNIGISGDGTGTATSFNGSADITIPFTLSNTGVTAGTYKSVTVDTKGRVTAGTNPTTLGGYGITDAVNSSDARLTNARVASDVYAWAKASVKPSYAFSEISSKPTTLGGYGITDAVLSTNRSNWNSASVIGNVIGQLAWNNFGNGHTIFDASAGTSPDGTAVNNTNAAVVWSGTYPNLMGWNGVSTYGVRVDSARNADYLSGLLLNTSGRADVPNQIVRTDSNGYINAGWINTTSGDNGTTAIGRIYASSDGYLRYYTPANFISLLNLIKGDDARLTNARVASDVYAWAKASVKPSYAFSEISSKPTTLGGYGITDAVNSSDPRLTDSRTPLTHAHTTSEVTNLDTVLASKALLAGSSSQAFSCSTLTAATSIYSSGNITAYSDPRLKKIISKIENPIEKLNQLNGYSYERLDLNNKKEIGLLTSDVKKVLPELVCTLKVEKTELIPDGILETLDYSKITALLVEVCKSQQSEIDFLKQQLLN